MSYRKTRTPLMEQIATVESLMSAWKKVRSNKGAPGIDSVTIQQYEQELQSNLTELVQRLQEERYYPAPVRNVNIPKKTGGRRTLGILTIEDRITQRAVVDVLEPIFEPEFLPCSFGYRKEKSVEHAIAMILDYQGKGYSWLVDADIKSCFEKIDHKLLMGFVLKKVPDRSVLRLIRMWLDFGVMNQAQSRLKGGRVSDTLKSSTLLDRTADFISEAADRAINSLLTNEGYGYQPSLYDGINLSSQDQNDANKQARKEAIMRLGKDGLLLLLTSYTGVRKILTKKRLMIAGPILLSLAAIPIGRAVAKRWKHSAGVIQGGPISPLLCNIYLHEFDKVMIKQGFRLVRFADDFVIFAPNERRAKEALVAAQKRLAELQMELNPAKTCIVRFYDEFQFLGYGFDKTGCCGPLPSKNAAQRLEHLKSILNQGGHNAVQGGQVLLQKSKRQVLNLTDTVRIRFRDRAKESVSKKKEKWTSKDQKIRGG